MEACPWTIFARVFFFNKDICSRLRLFQWIRSYWIFIQKTVTIIIYPFVLGFEHGSSTTSKSPNARSSTSNFICGAFRTICTQQGGCWISNGYQCLHSISYCRGSAQCSTKCIHSQQQCLGYPSKKFSQRMGTTSHSCTVKDEWPIPSPGRCPKQQHVQWMGCAWNKL